MASTAVSSRCQAHIRSPVQSQGGRASKPSCASLTRGGKLEGEVSVHLQTHRDQHIAASCSGQFAAKHSSKRAGRAARHLVLATSSSPAVEPPSSSNRVEAATGFLDAFWKFLRPHTIRGTILGTTAVVSRALMANPELIDWALLPRALLGLLALLCGNGYIVGINQVYDVEIDKVNKPFLPVAAGSLSIGGAWAICFGLAALGLGIVATNFVPLITGLYAFGLFLGTIYSVPPLRLKQFAVPAFLIIATVRGFLLNFGVFHATRAAIGLPFDWAPAILFITSFVTVFATAIAITKDLPDIEGDKAHQIDTFATRFGARNISLLGSGLLMLNYVGAVAAGVLFPSMFNQALMIPAHCALACYLAYISWRLEQSNYSQDGVREYYRSVWTLFYSEYFLLPFI